MDTSDQTAARSNPIPSRPAIGADYGISPDLDPAQCSWSRAVDRLAPSRNYWIGTTHPEGRPHAMPVWGVWQDDTLYFATSRNSRKARNLAANPAVVVHLESGDDVVVLEGEVEEVSDRPVLDRFADAYHAKYQFRPNTADAAQVVYRLRPRTAFTWGEKDYPQSALRWDFAP
ncbi:MAG: pyridoxamine 5'-phosphate oxidase family protein [Chloroflexota bacterium]